MSELSRSEERDMERMAREDAMVANYDPADHVDDGPDPDEGCDDYDEYGFERACMSCGGDGFRECDDDDCFHAPPGHLVTCFNCRGSGDRKDQWLW